MEEYLIFATIGGLLFLTLFVNSVSEAYEQKQREKRIKILHIKQGLDELSELLDALKDFNIGNDINVLLANEIMARLQMIQSLDKHFRGIQALIEEAKTEHASLPDGSHRNETAPNNETHFKKNLIKLGRLIRILNSHNWFFKVNSEKLKQYINDIQLLRCEKIFQFYSDMASIELKNEKYMIAKEHYYYILHALKGSGINTNSRVLEMLEQTEFMLDQSSTIMRNKTQERLAEASSSDTQGDEEVLSEKEANDEEPHDDKADSRNNT